VGRGMWEGTKRKLREEAELATGCFERQEEQWELLRVVGGDLHYKCLPIC
jgi:hypothetical protein